MRTIHRMVVKSFVPLFLMVLAFFTFAIELFDLFANLHRYLNKKVLVETILYLQWLYLPKAVFFALPLGLLFAVAWSISDYMSRNELIAVLSGGVSLYRFVAPYLIIGVLLSVFMFLFSEKVVIDASRQHKTLYNTVLEIKPERTFTNIALLSEDQSTVFFADMYNADDQSVGNLREIIRIPSSNGIVRRDSARAVLGPDGVWELMSVTIYRIDMTERRVTRENHASLRAPELLLDPKKMEKNEVNVEEMQAEQAFELIDEYRRTGRPYKAALTDVFKRYSFSLLPLLVMLYSTMVSSFFRKNVLVFTMLISISVAVSYYGLQMITSLLAKYGSIDPFLGAWIPFVLFFLGGAFLYRHART